MAFKFILGHHIKRILNDTEEKHKMDIKDYAGGHLNESRLLKTSLALPRKHWANAQTGKSNFTQTSKVQHKPKDGKRTRTSSDALYDFSLGTYGVIPPLKSKVPKPPEIRYKLITEEEKEGEDKCSSSMSLYCQLEDGILVEELPSQEIMLPLPHIHKNNQKTADIDPSSDQSPLGVGSVLESQTSATSKEFSFGTSFPSIASILSMHSVTKRDQYRKMKDFDSIILQKNEMSKQRIFSGEEVARHHEQKLHQTEYDNYIAKLLESQTSHQKLKDQVEQLVSQGTSCPDKMSEVTKRLISLEAEARHWLDMNQRLKENVRREQSSLNKTPEVPAYFSTNKLPSFTVKISPPSAIQSWKKPPVEFSSELETMKALILEKLDERNALRQKLREEFVPVTVCTHLEQCIKETEVEVQKLLKQNEYFERSIAEMEMELKEAIIEADTSEKDARRIWRKVNSIRGLPGRQQTTTGTESDEDEDDESKWNWYIS